MIYYEICNNILAVQRREHTRKELIPLSKRKRGLLLLARQRTSRFYARAVAPERP